MKTRKTKDRQAWIILYKQNTRYLYESCDNSGVLRSGDPNTFVQPVEVRTVYSTSIEDFLVNIGKLSQT